MAEVATRGPMLPSSNPIQFDGSSGNGGSLEDTVAIERKTPAELRDEQLKRRRTMDLLDESSLPKLESMQDSDGVTCEPTKPYLSRYIDTRIDDLFPSKKNNMRMLSGKKNVDYADAGQSFKKCTFRRVTELSLGSEKFTSIDTDEAFKKLAAGVSPTISTVNESFEGNANPASAKFCSEFHVPGLNIPLDFTLKTSMRVVSSSSVNWLMSCGTKRLHSWVHPQCSLPTSVITALKGEGEMGFLRKRQLAWENSFRSLYVMLRKNTCNIFYVCTREFVAIFTNGSGVCNAYLSHSTRALQSLLKEQDICFTTPICESLLVFSGNRNVHGLYDFLLNYRFFFPSLTSDDVPLLYSPVPFENAALSAPEVKCKSSTSSYSIEITDAYLPPWIISSVCDVLASNGDDFEASFVTEPKSVGLNVVLDLKASDEECSLFGIKNVGFSPQLSRAFVNSLKFSDGSYTASLSPV